jgi:hypothetical protein
MIVAMQRIVTVCLVGFALGACCAAVAVAGPAAASTPITKPEAIAFVRAVNLRARDLVGTSRARGTLEEGRKSKCAGPPGTAPSPPVYSAVSYLETLNELVISGVRVMPTEALAEAQLAEVASPSGRACFIKSLPDRVDNKRKTSVTFRSLARTLGPGAMRIRISRLHNPKTYVDVFIFRVGPAEFTLLTVGAPRPFSMATEERLLSLLHRRSEAHKL